MIKCCFIDVSKLVIKCCSMDVSEGIERNLLIDEDVIKLLCCNVLSRGIFKSKDLF